MRLSLLLVLSGVHLLCSAQVISAQDPEPIRTAIDRLLALPGQQAMTVCSDAEFIRRISLDLVGMTPTATEVRTFLTDPDPQRREKLVDRLLASPRFTRHLATSIDLWLMERRANSNVPQDDWHNWLLKSLREGKSWSDLVRVILTADGNDPATRPAARFYLDRGSEPNQIARDIGRVFFGRDMQCAQCHDHPLIDDYKQADYQGLLAFAAPGYVVPVKAGDKTTNIHGEKSGTDLQFESVFFKGALHRTPPRIPGGLWIDEPHYYPGDEYTVAPADNVPAVPKFSRRAKLAELATSGTNRAFNENIANRLWAHLFGRGLVYPLDMHHPDNPAASPELMRLLGERLAATQFNMPAFLRELALSQTYQRPFDAPAGLLTLAAPDQTLAAEEAERARLDAELTTVRAAYDKAFEDYGTTEKQFLLVAAELDTARTKYADAQKALSTVQAAGAEAQKLVNAKQEVASTLQAAVTAAQAATAKLPTDTDLAAAAQKFVERAQQIGTEVTMLQKSLDEKTAAITAAASTLEVSKTAIDHALAHVQPIRQALQQRDVELLAKRTELQDRSTALSALDAKLRSTRQLIQLASMRQSFETAAVSLASRQMEQQTAQSQLTAYVPVLAERETLFSAASKTMEDARVLHDASLKEQTTHQSIVSDLTNAVAASESAQSKLAGDTVLAAATTQLKDRLTALQVESASFQSKVDAASTALTSAMTGQAAAKTELDAAQTEKARLEQVVAMATAASSAAETERVRLAGEVQTLESVLVDRLSQSFSLSTLRPLTPEQMGWSIFQVTGVNDRYWSAEVSEMEKTAPMTEAQKGDPTALAARERDVEQKAFDKLKGNMAQYVRYYGAEAGQPQGDFFATADQALFAANGGPILSWVAPTGGNVTEKVATLENLQVAAEELYLSTLSRFPTESESTAVVQTLTARPTDRPVAAQELVWALLNSAEFRFNH